MHATKYRKVKKEGMLKSWGPLSEVGLKVLPSSEEVEKIRWICPQTVYTQF